MCKDHFAPRPWEAPLTPLDKGIPRTPHPVPLDQVAAQGWSLTQENLSLPAALLRQSAVLNNSGWMRGFLDRTGADLAPHGKTTMAPSLFDLQLRDNAWAITVSTPQHVAVALAAGCPRIFMANQLVGRRNIRDVLEGLKNSPATEFFCLVDDPNNVAELARTVRSVRPGRKLRVLVELGYAGGRTGCRSVEQALDIAHSVQAENDALDLVGVEGFEGLLRNDGSPEVLAQVDALLDGMAELAKQADAAGCFTGQEILLSAGGSSYYDIVTRRMAEVRLSRPTRVLIRSGCYITHDSHMYVRARKALARRDPGLAATGDLVPALEIWAYVQSRPEPAKAIVAFGKRDSSYDDPPIPLKWFRPGFHQVPVDLPNPGTVEKLNDQHCHLCIAPDSPLRVGDMLGFGISHPCLTFDKWRVLLTVDDNYRVTGAIRTYF